ncbi:MAG: response regulator [Deltaproteobacteria bacterium]|nr:response regulator [Deltaproteobacteria bacterium]
MAKILIIDDEEAIREMLQVLLEKAGYEVQVAVDGKEGVDLFRTAPAELVITDLFMPNRDGLDIIKEFRLAFPDVKIIAISGGGMVGVQEETKKDLLAIAREFGACCTFVKPFNLNDILFTVNELLGDN